MCKLAFTLPLHISAFNALEMCARTQIYTTSYVLWVQVSCPVIRQLAAKEQNVHSPFGVLYLNKQQIFKRLLDPKIPFRGQQTGALA